MRTILHLGDVVDVDEPTANRICDAMRAAPPLKTTVIEDSERETAASIQLGAFSDPDTGQERWAVSIGDGLVCERLEVHDTRAEADASYDGWVDAAGIVTDCSNGTVRMTRTGAA